MQRITNTGRAITSPGNEAALREQGRTGPTPLPAWQGFAQHGALARRPPPQGQTSTPSPPQQPINVMPPELLNKLHSHVASPRDRAHFALTNTAMLSATMPATPNHGLAHLQEAAQCAKDFGSFMVTLDKARQLPEAPRAGLFRELASRVADIAQWATSSQAHIQAAAPQAEQSFRQLWHGIAELSRSLQPEPLFVLGQQLRALPPANRLETMEAILTATREAFTNPQRHQLLEYQALQLNQFPLEHARGAARQLLNEAAQLPQAQRRTMCDALRSGLAGAISLAADRAAILGAIDQVSPSTPVARPSGRDLLGFKRTAR